MTSSLHSGQVHFQVWIEDELIPGGIEVTKLTIQKEAGHIPAASLQIIDGEAAERTFAHSSGDWFVPGNRIEIKAAYGKTELAQTLFKGIVVKQNLRATGSGKTGLSVDCRHTAYRMTLGRKSAVYEQKSDEEILAALLQAYEIPKSIGPDGRKHERIVQFNATDWDFFMTRVDASGKLCFLQDDQLLIETPNFSLPAAKELGFGDNLLEFEAHLDSRTQPGEVIANRWNPANQEAVQDSASRAQTDGPGNISSKELSETTGFETENLHFSGSLYGYDNFTALAQAKMLRYNLAKIQGRGKIRGDAALIPGDFVTLSGMGKRIDGKAFVCGVRHEIGRGGWYTYVHFGMSAKFHTENYAVHSPPAAGVMPAVTGLQIGVVESLKHSNNDEKQGLERIAVSLPVMGKNIEVWARPATLYAGDGRGVVFRPKEKDEVIVGFLDGDPSQAVILGALYHNKSVKAPLQNETSAHDKLNGIFTKEGMAITFDEENKTLNLETKDGPSILLDDGNQKALTLSYKGNKIVLNDQGITIESGAALEFKSVDGFKFSSEKSGMDIQIPGGTFGFTAKQAQMVGGSEMKLQATKIDLN